MASLPEELALLAHDDTTGRDRSGGHLDLGLAGAVLYELALAGRVGVEGGRVRVLDPAPTGDPLADAGLAAIGADKPRIARVAVERTAKGLKRTVLDDLVARGVLRHERGKALGLFPVNRYFPQDPNAKADARARISAAARSGRAFDDRTKALLSLVSAIRVDAAAFPDRASRPSRKELRAMGGDSWVGEAVRKAVSHKDAASAAAASSGGGA